MENLLHLGPPLEQANLAIVLVHGRGSSGRNIARLIESLPSNGVSWLIPSAEHGSWYPHRFLAPLEQNEPWLSQALETIDHLVGRATAAGIPSNRIGLIGFSQGACLSLEYAVRHPKVYGFVAGLSGGLIGPAGTHRPKADLMRTPVLLGCAEHDAHIPFEYVEETDRILRAFNADVTLQKYPGSDHTVFEDERIWLRQQIENPGNPSR